MKEWMLSQAVEDTYRHPGVKWGVNMKETDFLIGKVAGIYNSIQLGAFEILQLVFWMVA